MLFLGSPGLGSRDFGIPAAGRYRLEAGVLQPLFAPDHPRLEELAPALIRVELCGETLHELAALLDALAYPQYRSAEVGV